jgi:hypothetical protein
LRTATAVEEGLQSLESARERRRLVFAVVVFEIMKTQRLKDWAGAFEQSSARTTPAMYCPFDQKKIIIFSNLTDLAVICCVLHSHGE